MKSKFSIWKMLVPLLAIILALALIFFAFGEHILIYIAPKAVLSSALNTALSQLEERGKGNPLILFAEVLGWEGKYHAVMEAKASNDLLGEVCYDMTVNADTGAHRLLAEGKVTSLERDLDITVYLDDEYMALSSNDLLKGSFYGITYDSFSSDIRSFPLIDYVIPASTIQEWEDSVSEIQQTMSRSYELPQVPDISEEEVNALMLGIMALPSRVTVEELRLNGETVPCRKISYSACGIRMDGLLNADNAAVSVDFYLYENQLVRACADITTTEKEISVSFSLGKDLVTSPVLIQYSEREGGLYRNFVVSVSTKREGNLYLENWSIHKTEGGEEESVSFSYEYSIESGDMLLTVGQEATEAFRLIETENGIHLETEDIFGLLQSINREKIASDAEKVSCTLTLSEGSSIAAPAYKNLDMWSMEDLLALLGGMGSLLGINTIS